MKNLSKIVLGVSLLGGTVFTTPLQVDTKKEKPSKVETIDNLKRVFSSIFGNGTLTFQKRIVKSCFQSLQGVIYRGEKGTFKGNILKFSTLSEYPKWFSIEGAEGEFPKGVFTLEDLQLFAQSDTIAVSFEGLKVKPKEEKTPIEVKEGFLYTFAGKSSTFFSLKGLVKVPEVGDMYRYFSFGGGAYADFSSQSGNVFLRGTFEGLLSTKISLTLKGVNKRVVEELRTLASEGKNAKLPPNSALMAVVPEKLTLRFELGKELKKELQKDREDLLRDIKPYLSQKGVIGDFARAVYKLVEGQADGIKIEVENSQGLNLGQLTGVFLLLSMAQTDSQIEKIFDTYFRIKISTF